jgi:hypothetical protein
VKTLKNLRKIEEVFSDHHIEKETWALLIGRFMMVFGEIENFTLFALQRISTDSIMETASSLLLQKRIELLIEVVGGREGISNEARENLIKILVSVKHLADKRNLIAHNPMLLVIRTESPSDEMMGQGVISSSRNENKKITLDMMKDLVEQVDACRTLL